MHLQSRTFPGISSCDRLFWAGLIQSWVLSSEGFLHWPPASFSGAEAIDGTCVKHKVKHFKDFFKGSLERYQKEIFMPYKCILFSHLVSADVEKRRQILKTDIFLNLEWFKLSSVFCGSDQFLFYLPVYFNLKLTSIYILLCCAFSLLAYC